MLDFVDEKSPASVLSAPPQLQSKSFSFPFIVSSMYYVNCSQQLTYLGVVGKEYFSALAHPKQFILHSCASGYRDALFSCW